jgi:hypothetical protein
MSALRTGGMRIAALVRARDALAATRDPADAAQAAMAAADAAWAELRASVEQAGALACRAGCAACCHQRVAVLPAEAALIARHLRAGDPAARATRRARLAAPRGARAPCPFLDDGGACAIYAVRPSRCRGLHSRNAAACRKWTDIEERGGHVPAGIDAAVFPPEPIALMDAALAGLGQALQEAGADIATLELAAAVAACLDGLGEDGGHGDEAVASPGKMPIFLP